MRVERSSQPPPSQVSASHVGLLTRSRLTLVSPLGQRVVDCLSSRHSPRLSVVRNETDTFHIRARRRRDMDQVAQAAGTGTPSS